MNRTFVLKKGQLLKEHIVNWSVVDTFLLESLEHVPALPLDGTAISLEIAHFQPGVTRKGDKAPFHVHDAIHFQFALEGAFLFKTSRHSILLKPGYGIIIPVRQVHSWACERSGVLFGASIGVTGQTAKIFCDYIKNLGAGNFLPYSDPRLADALASIIAIALKPAPFHWRREMIACELMLWTAQSLHTALDLCLMKTPAPSSTPARTDASRRLCQEAVRFIMANFNRPISLREAAGHAGVTPRHLNRLFQRYLHETAHRFLLRTRLEYADKMFKSSPALKVKEIAFASGFKNPAYFTRCFKRHFSRLPAGKNARFNACAQNAVSNEFDSSQASTYRLNQSITATRYR